MAEKKSKQFKQIGDYVLHRKEVLGSGQYGKVYSGHHPSKPEQLVAIKKIDFSKNSVAAWMFEREISIQEKCNHINIVRLYQHQRSRNDIYLVLERCDGGDLSQYLKNNGPLPEAIAKRFLRDLVLGLGHLREQKFVHRDLKPQNLLLDKKDINTATLKIADFGMARSLNTEDLAGTVVGSPYYMAPELVRGFCLRSPTNYNAYKSDIWSVGVILFEMVYGQSPFADAKDRNQLHEQVQEDVRFPGNISISPHCILLIRRLLRRDPDARMSFPDLLTVVSREDFVGTVVEDTKTKTHQPTSVDASGTSEAVDSSPAANRTPIRRVLSPHTSADLHTPSSPNVPPTPTSINIPNEGTPTQPLVSTKQPVTPTLSPSTPKPHSAFTSALYRGSTQQQKQTQGRRVRAFSDQKEIPSTWRPSSMPLSSYGAANSNWATRGNGSQDHERDTGGWGSRRSSGSLQQKSFAQRPQRRVSMSTSGAFGQQLRGLASKSKTSSPELLPAEPRTPVEEGTWSSVRELLQHRQGAHCEGGTDLKEAIGKLLVLTGKDAVDRLQTLHAQSRLVAQFAEQQATGELAINKGLLVFDSNLSRAGDDQQANTELINWLLGKVCALVLYTKALQLAGETLFLVGQWMLHRQRERRPGSGDFGGPVSRAEGASGLPAKLQLVDSMQEQLRSELVGWHAAAERCRASFSSHPEAASLSTAPCSTHLLLTIAGERARGGAVDELMLNTTAAIVKYQQAVCLLEILQEDNSMDELGRGLQANQMVLKGYLTRLRKRLSICQAESQDNQAI